MAYSLPLTIPAMAFDDFEGSYGLVASIKFNGGVQQFRRNPNYSLEEININDETSRFNLIVQSDLIHFKKEFTLNFFKNYHFILINIPDYFKFRGVIVHILKQILRPEIIFKRLFLNTNKIWKPKSINITVDDADFIIGKQIYSYSGLLSKKNREGLNTTEEDLLKKIQSSPSDFQTTFLNFHFQPESKREIIPIQLSGSLIYLQGSEDYFQEIEKDLLTLLVQIG